MVHVFRTGTVQYTIPIHRKIACIPSFDLVVLPHACMFLKSIMTRQVQKVVFSIQSPECVRGSIKETSNAEIFNIAAREKESRYGRSM